MSPDVSRGVDPPRNAEAAAALGRVGSPRALCHCGGGGQGGVNPPIGDDAAGAAAEGVDPSPLMRWDFKIHCEK